MTTEEILDYIRTKTGINVTLYDDTSRNYIFISVPGTTGHWCINKRRWTSARGGQYIGEFYTREEQIRDLNKRIKVILKCLTE